MASTVEKKKSEPSKTLGPIIVDLGKRRRKDIKQLRQGTGELVDEVSECLQELVASGSVSADAQPVILIIREKQKNGMFLNQ